MCSECGAKNIKGVGNPLGDEYLVSLCHLHLHLSSNIAILCHFFDPQIQHLFSNCHCSIMRRDTANKLGHTIITNDAVDITN